MENFYEETSLTPMRVARLSGYIDWSSQPSLFKHYPRFSYRYAFDSVPALKLAELSRCITSRSDIGGTPYYRLNTPSAGNLHPLELYVQIRGIKDVISGIYHVDAHNGSLVLIREIEGDGIEPLVGLSHRFTGLIFIVSIVPFRSEWKYGKRAVRYCYLDAGHQTGAVIAAAEALGQSATILSNIDALSLNEQMGFTSQEYTTMAISVGKENDKNVTALSLPLIKVAPTDYWESMSSFTQQSDYYKYTVSFPQIKSSPVTIPTILARRSVRIFEDKMLTEEISQYFIKRITQIPDILNASIIMLKNSAQKPGIYKNSEINTQGDYAEKISHLLIDQTFIKNAAMVIVFTAEEFTPQRLITSGIFAHLLSLEAQEKEVGFTGIGAFYDEKLQVFLETEQPILYVCALGVTRK